MGDQCSGDHSLIFSWCYVHGISQARILEWVAISHHMPCPTARALLFLLSWLVFVGFPFIRFHEVLFDPGLKHAVALARCICLSALPSAKLALSLDFTRCFRRLTPALVQVQQKQDSSRCSCHPLSHKHTLTHTILHSFLYPSITQHSPCAWNRFHKHF